MRRARSSNPGYLPGGLQRQSEKQARSAKVERRQRAARAPIAVTDRDEVVAMTKIRKITAENMTLSKRTSAHVTTVFQVDYTVLARLREQLLSLATQITVTP